MHSLCRGCRFFQADVFSPRLDHLEQEQGHFLVVAPRNHCRYACSCHTRTSFSRQKTATTNDSSFINENTHSKTGQLWAAAPGAGGFAQPVYARDAEEFRGADGAVYQARARHAGRAQEGVGGDGGGLRRGESGPMEGRYLNGLFCRCLPRQSRLTVPWTVPLVRWYYCPVPLFFVAVVCVTASATVIFSCKMCASDSAF